MEQTTLARRSRFFTFAAAVGLVVSVALAAGCAEKSNVSKPDSITGLTTTDTEAPPDPEAFAFGQEFAIRDGAIAPAQLVAIKDRDVVFVNETAQAQELVFTNWVLDDGSTTTGTIPPGGSWSFRPVTLGSITFALATDSTVVGRLQVDPGVPCC
jgi:hypothetical protein